PVSGRRRPGGRRDTIREGWGEALRGRMALAQRGRALLLAPQSMPDVRRQNRLWIVDSGTVRGQQANRVKRLNARERREILHEIAAAAPVNHHAAAQHDEVAGQYRPARGVPEREMVSRMSWRMNRRQRLGAAAH